MKNWKEFIEAVTGDEVTSVASVIQQGIDINKQDKNGWSALHYAVNFGYYNLAQDLVKNGASIDVQDTFGNTPLWRAVFNFRDDGKIITLLLKHGANKDLKNKSGVSPAELAHSIANYPVAKYFA